MGTVISIDYTPEFLKEAKVLKKRYRSFNSDMELFLKDLIENPLSGDDLGNGLRKVRMAIASKSKGKRGGARVITLTIKVEENNSKSLSHKKC